MRHKNLILMICLILLIPVSSQALRFARWNTSMGEFTAVLRTDLAPITATNFIDLTSANFYDGLVFHRVIEGFVIQDGDPLGNGTGGPGYTIPDEFSPYLFHDSPGVLAMAKTTQPNSAGSQYYITLAPLPTLDGRYAIFGKVIEGMDVVFAISQVPTNANDHPITDVVIDSLRLLGLEINEYAPADTILSCQAGESLDFSVDAIDVNLFIEPEYQWLLDGVVQENQTNSFTNQFLQNGLHVVSCISFNTEVSYQHDWKVTVNGTGTEPNLPALQSIKIDSVYPNPFKETISIKYHSSSAQTIQMNVYDIKGRKIRHIETPASKDQELTWDAKDHQGHKSANGIYLIEISNGSHKDLKKVMLIK